MKLGKQKTTGIEIKIGDAKGNMGFFDTSTGEIILDKSLSKVGRYHILIHELLHVVECNLIQEGFIKKRITHDFINNASGPLLHVLIEAGIIKGVTLEEFIEFSKEATHEK